MSHALRTRLSARLLIPGVLALVCGSVVSLPAAADDAAGLPVAPAAPAVSQATATDQFIVKFKDTAPAGPAIRTESYGKVARNLGIAVSDVRATADGARVLRAERTLDSSEAEQALAALRGDPGVEYAEPDIRMYPTAEPNDPYYPLQWGLQSGGAAGTMNMPDAWSLNRGTGVVVAVVDTGITSHSELNASVLPGYDMMSDPADSRDSGGRDANPRDEGDWTPAGMCGDGAPASPSSWHGTQVAGIIAAAANNSSGITGVAPEAKILPVRALGPCGGYMSDIADGIIWAAGGSVAGLPVNPNPARVINLSLGGDEPCPATFQSAVNFAYESGSAVIAAAGNQNRPAAETSPSNCQNVISVAALTRTGSLAPYSNYGPAVDVAAPGGDVGQASSDGILVAFNEGTQGPGAGTYAYSSGTSMAAPHASGLAALLMSRLGDLATPDNVEARLKATSTNNGSACVTKTCGSGLLQGTAALNFQPDREIKGVPPIIGGKAAVGQDLSAYAINWTPSDVTFSYQWNRNGAPIQGAQATTYLPQPADVGTTLTVTATGSRFFGQSVSVSSAPTAPVEAAPVVPPYDPFITGLGIVGGTVTAYTGTWQPAPVMLSFQWYRAGAAIPGATASTYTPAEEDKGTILTVRVTGTKDGYITVQRTSAAKTISTGVIPAPVQFTDRIGTANDTYTVPTTAGVEYTIGGKAVPAGTYPGVGYVLVSAKPMQGYALAGGPPGWEFVFDSSFFRDITDGSAFALEINWLATEEITQGWAEPDGKRTFRSAEPVNRDQMAAFLYRLAGNPDFVPPAVSPFADIPTNHAFYREISWLAAKHISTGWKEENGTRTFRPGATVNRDQMAAFIYRHAGSPDYVPEAQSRFVDIPTDHGFYKEISWLAKMGISNGWAESATTRSFRPGASILRDQMAAFMYRYAAQR